MNRAFFVLLVAVLLGGCGPKVPNLVEWDTQLHEIDENTGSVYYKYTKDEEVLEVMLDQKLDWVFMRRLGGRGRQVEWIHYQGAWQRCHIIDVVEDEPSGRVSVVWENRQGQEIETRF